MSEEDGTIILLYYMEKYTDREIGEILNMKENTVRTKRNRIKNKIKKGVIHTFSIKVQKTKKSFYTIV